MDKKWKTFRKGMNLLLKPSEEKVFFSHRNGIYSLGIEENFSSILQRQRISMEEYMLGEALKGLL